MLRRRDPIDRLCRKSGNWVMTEVEANYRHWVTHRRDRADYPVMVLHGSHHTSTRFQCWLPVRFPLANPPSGLFGRLMLRSWDLNWSSWVLNIGESCEAKACVTALVPNRALDTNLFNIICQEQVEEVSGMHKELRDKFQYSGQFRGGPPASSMGGSGMPVRWQGDLPQRLY